LYSFTFAEILAYILEFVGHNYIRTEHLLLGLLRVGEGVAACVLENLGADPTNIRNQVSMMASENGSTCEWNRRLGALIEIDDFEL
jgi:ATP-dependent Clp protease ATP-binding subunit ClpA